MPTHPMTVFFRCSLILTASFLLHAVALACPQSVLAQFDQNPPIVYVMPSGATVGSSTLQVRIEWCDDQNLLWHTRSVTLNGQNVTSSFSADGGVTQTNCTGAYASSLGTITLSAGVNTLSASIQDWATNVGTGYGAYTYTTVAVTPDAGGVQAPQRSSAVSQQFTVKNIGSTSATFNLTRVCTANVSPCSSASSVTLGAGDSTAVAVTYATQASSTTGTIKLHAAASTNPALKDSGWVDVTAVSSLVANTFSNNDNQNMGLCATSCFAVTHAQGTVPYFSLDGPRNVGLAYHGDRVAVRPFIYADVSLLAGADSVNEYWFQVKDSTGAFIPFLNGDATKIRFRGGPVPSAPIRLGGQIDASGWVNGTGMYPIQIIVTAVRSTFNEQHTYDTKLLVINERKSYIARGWTVAGVQRLYPQGSAGVLVTEGEGSANYFSCGGSSPCMSPPGEYSRLSYTGSGSSTVYTRAYRDSTKAWFRSTGQMDSIADRFGNKVRFEYDGSLRLTRIYDPIRTYSGGASRSYIALTYGTYGLSQIQEPGADGSPTGGRVTVVTVNTDSTLRVIQDPDGQSTQFGYDGDRRLSTVTDRRGSTTTFVYDSPSWKLARTDLPQIPIDAGGGSTQNATPSITYSPWQTVGVPTTSTSSSLATWARTDTLKARVTDAGGHTTSYTVDRWGQPLVTTDALGNVTTIVRDGIFPKSVTSPTGNVDRFEYGGGFLYWQKLAAQDTTYFSYDSYSQVLSVYGPRQVTQQFFRSGVGRLDSVKVAGLKTLFTYDSRGRPTVVTDPANHTTRYHYEDTFGNRDSTIAPGGRFTTARFDRYGRDSVTKANGTPTRTVLYDLLNRVTQDSANIDPRPTRYTYDQLFFLQVKDARGQIYKSDVNALGWKTREYDPADTVTWNRYTTYRYNLDGLVTSWTNRRGERIDHLYDAGHRLTSKRGPANVVADSFWYNPTGTITVGINTVSRDSIARDAFGRTLTVATTVAEKTFRRHYTWTGDRRPDSITYETTSSIVLPGQHYFWNGTSRALDSVRVGDSIAVWFGRNGEQLDSTTTWPGFVTRTMLYTTNHEPYQSSFNTTAIDTAFRRAYGYSDSLFRFTEISRKQGNDTKVRSYSYDDLGRLRRLQYGTIVNNTCPSPPNLLDGGFGCATPSLVADTIFGFHYDSVGNLAKQRDSTHSISITGTHAVGNRITAWGGATYTADLDGNVDSKTSGGSTTSYGWTADGRLKSVTAGTVTLTYDYNAFGQLVRRSRNSTVERHFLWDEGQLWLELDGAAANRVAGYAYLPGVDRPLALVTGAQVGRRYAALPERRDRERPRRDLRELGSAAHPVRAMGRRGLDHRHTRRYQSPAVEGADVGR